MERENLKEVKTYECPECKGRGDFIADWDAYNQIAPAGFNKRLQKKNKRLMERAISKCGRCKGRGFIVLPVEESKE